MEIAAIWLLMAGALGIGYLLRWWETKPERLWRDVYLANKSEQEAAAHRDLQNWLKWHYGLKGRQ